MDEKEKQIEELIQSRERWQVWFSRLQNKYNELDKEKERLRQRVEELTKERDSLLGDVTKLKALTAELEAKQETTDIKIITP